MMAIVGCALTIMSLMEIITILEFLDFSMVCVANRYRCYPSVTLTVTPLTYLLTYTYKVKVSKGNKVTLKHRYHARVVSGAAMGISCIYLSRRVTCYVSRNLNNARPLDRNTSRYR